MPVLRIQIDEATDDLLKALSAACRKKPAQVIALALKQFEQGERMEAATKALNQRNSQRDDLALAIDHFYKAERALVETRERLEAEALLSSYAVDDLNDHQF